MTKIYQFNFDRGHAYSIGEGFGADSLEGIGFLNFPQGYAYMRNLIYREDGWVRPPFSIGNYHSAAGTGALKGVYFAIDGLYVYTENNQLLFSQGGNGDWQMANWVGTGSEPVIGVDANRNIQWFDDYGLPLFTSPVATEPVFWAYQKQDIFGDIDIPPTDTGGEPVPDPPIITDPTNPYVNPYPNAQYYYHNAGRTNWVRGINKNFSPKGTGQVYKTFDAGEAIGLAEGGKLFGYPKVYSLPSCDQTGEDLPATFIAWDGNSIGVKDGVRYASGYLYNYNNYTRTSAYTPGFQYLFDIAGYTETKTYETEIIYGEESECLKKITWNIYNWSNEIIDTIEYEFTYPQVFSFVAQPDGYLSSSLKASVDGKIYISLVFFNLLTGDSFPVDMEEVCYFYNNGEWEQIGNCQYKSNPFSRYFTSGEGYKIEGFWSNFGDEHIIAYAKDYSNPILSPSSIIEDWNNLGYVKISSFEILGSFWNFPSNNIYGFHFVSLTNKDMDYKVYNIEENTDTDKTITLPLSANSTNFQIKESVITDDNIVYFVYHDLTNSKIGIIGIDIIENLVYYSYEENCTSFPTNQKLFHYGSYIGFKTQNNWKIIN